MPTRKISDEAAIKPCRHHDHNPPSMMHFEPGVYEHECPECGTKQTFRVSAPELQVYTCACHGDGSYRSGHGQVHYVDVGSIPPKDVMAYVQGVRDSMKFIPVR